MAGGRGRGRRGQVPDEEVHHQDRSVQDVMIEDLQRQVAELTRRLAVQEIDDREEEGLASESSLENPYHHPYHHQSYHPHPFHREYRGREESQWSLSFWVDLPEFAGTLHAEGFIDWLDEVEEIFEYKEVPDHMKVKLVALKLKGRASIWWKQLKQSRERQGMAKITEWEKMKKKMKKYFLPFGYAPTLFQRLHSLRREKRSVDDYIEEFCHIRQPLQGQIFNPNFRYFRLDESGHRATKCKKATNSWRKALLIEEETVEVFEETNDPIYDVEEDVEEKFGAIGNPIYDMYDDDENEVRCVWLGQNDFISTPVVSCVIQEQVGAVEAITENDITKDCADGQVLSLLQSFDAQFQEDVVLENTPLSHLMPEIGEPVYDVYDAEEDGDVFYEDCHERVCNMIFDSCSYENVVFDEDVQKLQMDRHSKSYKMLWLNKNKEVDIEDPYQVGVRIDPPYFFVNSKEIEFNSNMGALYVSLHGGANEFILKMPTEIDTIINTPYFTDDKKGRKRKLSVFGHGVYKNYHHRA